RGHDPPDRARDARGDGAGPARLRPAPRRVHLLGHSAGSHHGCAGARELPRHGGRALMLEIRDLSVFYGDAQALDQMSLSVGANEIVALVGANGAGKTSLIRTVAGILKPRSGSIRFEGEEIGGLDSHRVCNLGIG